MLKNPCNDGWNRIAGGLDLKVQHGIPVGVSSSGNQSLLNNENISDKVFELTGLRVSVQNWINASNDEQKSQVCIDRKQFEEVLRRLALSSAAMFVDRYHRPIDRYAVDWDTSEFNYDFNHAIEYCCMPYDSLNKEKYFDKYIQTMHEESVRLVDEGVSPLVEAE
jgi:hypothetical protein